MKGLLFGGLLRLHLFATTSASERNGGQEENEQQRDKEGHFEINDMPKMLNTFNLSFSKRGNKPDLIYK